jgi:hypothetical protein
MDEEWKVIDVIHGRLCKKVLRDTQICSESVYGIRDGKRHLQG